jgi:hypothetical protein
MTALLEQFKAVARIALYLAVAFLLIELWQDPSGAASATKDFIGSIGHFFSAIIDKVAEFVKSFGGHTGTPSTPSTTPAP